MVSLCNQRGNWLIPPELASSSSGWENPGIDPNSGGRLYGQMELQGEKCDHASALQWPSMWKGTSSWAEEAWAPASASGESPSTGGAATPRRRAPSTAWTGWGFRWRYGGRTSGRLTSSRETKLTNPPPPLADADLLLRSQHLPESGRCCEGRREDRRLGRAFWSRSTPTQFSYTQEFWFKPALTPLWSSWLDLCPGSLCHCRSAEKTTRTSVLSLTPSTPSAGLVSVLAGE